MGFDRKKWLVLTVIVIKMIMDGLDMSMLNIALPTISTSLGVTTGAVVWTVSVYTITASATVLFFGRLGDIIGKTRFYLIGIAIYAVSTLFGGMANSLGMLVVARIIQGLGASCTMANSQGIIAMVFPQEQRGMAMGIYGGAVAIGTLAGPTLGGVIVAFMDWHYIFLLKIPIVVIALLLGVRFFPKDETAEKEKLDYPGAFMYMIAIVPLLYSLQVGFEAGYASVQFISGIVISAIAMTVFILRQRRTPSPLLDLSILKNPIYTVSIFTGFVLYFSNSFRNIVVPFYLQGILGISPHIAGLYMSIAPIVILLITPISGYLTDRMGGERLAIVGQIINLAGLLLMSTLGKESRAMVLVAYFCIANIGTAIFNAPNNTLIMSNLPQNKLGIGGSVSMGTRNIGMSLGVALTTAILYGGMSKYLGYPVTGYLSGAGQDDAFIFGMRNAYYTTSIVCVAGIAASIVRIKMLAGTRANQVIERITFKKGGFTGVGGYHISIQQLFKIVYKLFVAMGYDDADATYAADVLVETDRRGVDTHGVARLSFYNMVSNVENAVNKSAKLSIVRDEPPYIMVDGDCGLGIIMAPKAVEIAIDRAEKQGICVMGVRNAGHFGAAGYYADKCVRKGFVSLVCSNSGSIMAPHGGKEGFLGNSPWSIAVPGGNRHPDPVMFDMACSGVARGKIETALREGRQVPLGWGLDKDGNPTTDPKSILRGGCVLPLGGVKGYCITLLLEVLSSMLTFASFGNAKNFTGKHNDNSYFVLLLDPVKFGSLEMYRDSIDLYIDQLKSVPLAPDADEILFPGELEARAIKDRTAFGVELNEGVAASLAKVARGRGLLAQDRGFEDMLTW